MVLILLYAWAGLCFWWLIVGMIYGDMVAAGQPIEPGYVTMIVLLGLGFGALWPIGLPAAVCTCISRRGVKTFFLLP